MTISPEEWLKLEAALRDESRVLLSRHELRAQLAHQQPQPVRLLHMPTDAVIMREIDWSHRRKGNQRIVDEEWSVTVGDVRALEDLVLECVDAGIDISLYL